MEIPLRSAGAYSSLKNPWPREKENETKDTAFAVQNRKLQWKRQGQGNRWDQCGDSSSAASPSASAEEGGKETHIMTEKANQWGPWSSHESETRASCSLYRLQQANRGEGRQSSGLVIVPVPLGGAHLTATIVPGSIKVMILQSGMDQSDLLQLQST